MKLTHVYGKITGELLTTFENPYEVAVFKKAFKHARRKKVELEEVDYDLIITDRKGDVKNILQFYLGEEGEQSAFFYIGYEDKVYFTSEEITQQLRGVILP